MAQNERLLSERKVFDLLSWCAQLKLEQKEAVCSDLIYSITTATQKYKNVVFFCDASQNYAGLPLPQDTLPVCISQHFSLNELTRSFQLKPMNLFCWWDSISKRHSSLVERIEFAPKILSTLSLGWKGLADAQRTEIRLFLNTKRCVTAVLNVAQEMRRPGEVVLVSKSKSKLPNELLERLPVLVPQQIPEEFYMDLGVQASVPVEMLVSHFKFPQELQPVVRHVSDGYYDEEQLKQLVSSLEGLGIDFSRYFMPIAHLRGLRLRVLPWEGEISADEQKVLEMLSVRSHPLVQDLLEVASNSLDFHTRVLALDFLESKFYDHYSRHDFLNDEGIKHYRFLLADSGTWCAPNQCFLKTYPLSGCVLHPRFENLGRLLKVGCDNWCLSATTDSTSSPRFMNPRRSVNLWWIC